MEGWRLGSHSLFRSIFVRPWADLAKDATNPPRRLYTRSRPSALQAGGSGSRESETRSTLTSAFHPGTDVSCCRVADALAGSPAGPRTRSSTVDAS
ncbi:hypothetical protein CGRA01v4_09040 [Colletotrichum graminicola]|nr:hypothetical protein CGRA01v4_09040 [Colletotrichum graminicola]